MVKCCDEYSGGDLRETITIQRKTRTPDAQGGFVVTWATLKVARAMIKAAPGGEKWGFMREVPGNTYKVVLRFFGSDAPGVAAKDRVMWRGREYGILGVVDPDGRRRWLEMRMSDGVAS